MSYENHENENNDMLEEEEDIYNNGRGKFIRIVSLIMALCLGVIILTPIIRNMNLPDLNFLKESSELTEKSEIKEFQKAIVTVTVGNRKGTGFNINEKGLIVTNEHVIQGEKDILISFYKGKKFKGQVWKTYKDIDLALIRVEGKDLPRLKLAHNVETKKGNEVLIIGNPLRYKGVANKGEVYGVSKVKGFEESILLIEVPVNEGNSGSPVINEKGEVIGVIFGTVESEELSDKKLGAAIPIEYLQKLDSYHRQEN